MKNAAFMVSALSLVVLSACGTGPRLEDAQYWQRKSATSALYLQGPKAQQTLHQDIAGCVNEINELQRLGAIRDAVPGEAGGSAMSGWDTPERDGYLYAEHSNYHDFDGCMDYHGWERVAYLPYERVERARHDYLETVYGERYQTRQNNGKYVAPAPEGSFDNLND